MLTVFTVSALTGTLTANHRNLGCGHNLGRGHAAGSRQPAPGVWQAEFRLDFGPAGSLVFVTATTAVPGSTPATETEIPVTQDGPRRAK